MDEPGLVALWDLHGRAVYALACIILDDRMAAVEAVTLGMADVADSTATVSARDARRSMARHVYRRSQELAGKTAGMLDVPEAMVWLGQRAQLQRACLALCLFGGHTYGEAADLLGVPAMTVAELLRTGMGEVAHTATAESPTRA